LAAPSGPTQEPPPAPASSGATLRSLNADRRRKISARSILAPRAAYLHAQAADAARKQHMEQIHMKLSTLPTAVAVAALVFAAVAATPTRAQMKEQTVNVGRAPTYPSKNTIQNAGNSKDHTTLAAPEKAARPGGTPPG